MLAFLIRAAIALGLTVFVFGQMGASPVALLVMVFLVTVVWTPLTRKEVF
jgi:hypothetical protein